MKPKVSYSFIVECPDCGTETGLPEKEFNYSPMVRCYACSRTFDATNHRTSKFETRPSTPKPKGLYGDH